MHPTSLMVSSSSLSQHDLSSITLSDDEGSSEVYTDQKTDHNDKGQVAIQSHSHDRCDKQGQLNSMRAPTLDCVNPDHDSAAVHTSIPVFQLSVSHALDRRPSGSAVAHLASLSNLTKQQRDMLEKERRKKKDEEYILPLVTLLLSLLFPPVGCFGFMYCVKSEIETPRYVWAVRSLYVGSALSFIYMFIISSIIGHFFSDGH